MGVQKCLWGTCKSDQRNKDKDFMKGVTFFVFPKPVENNDMDPQTIKCREWIKACCRPAEQLNIKKIIDDKRKQKYYYRICSKVCRILLMFHNIGMFKEKSIIAI